MSRYSNRQLIYLGRSLNIREVSLQYQTPERTHESRFKINTIFVEPLLVHWITKSYTVHFPDLCDIVVQILSLYVCRFVTYNRVTVATMTHFCTFGSVTPVLIIGFGWFFFQSIDLEVKQLGCKFWAHYLTLTLEREWNVKTFFVSWWQITSYNDTPSCHDDTFKKYWKQWGYHDPIGNKFSHKKILYFWQKCDFCSFISISIHYDHL